MEECMSRLGQQTDKLLYNRNECQRLLIHVEAFATSLTEKSFTQDSVDLQARLSKTLTDLSDVLADILKSPQLKQILWRDGISSLISGVYKIIDDPSSNTFAEHDSIRKAARSLDVDHFHEMIETTRSDQILERLGVPTSQHSTASMALRQHVKKFPDGGSKECQFLQCAIENLPEGHTSDDSFAITEFDVVVHCNRMLGKGGFGAVFEGNWRGTKVAIKRIAYFHPALGANEINILRSLEHDHIVQFFGANPDPYQSFLVCALKSQGDVSKFLRKNPNANRRKLSYEASLGLAYLHEKLVIHGDIKPMNILVDGNGTSCLCDFGLSRVRTLLTQPPTSPLRNGEPPAGTICYMSPEQMQYGRTNEQTDVYSFGMTIYEIFSGIPPFNDSGWTSLRNDVVDFSDRPSKPDIGIDDKLWNLITDCWSQDPSKRPMAATVSSTLRKLKNCAIEATFAQPYIVLAAGKAGGMSSHHITTSFPPPTLPCTHRSDVSDTTKVETKFMSQTAGEMMSKKNRPVMILLMGEIGAGKSTFINAATAKPLSTVGHDLDPCTLTSQDFVVDRDGRDVVFVDTPGFNHPTKPDRVILEEIVNWLKNIHPQETDTHLGGIIFLHDLSEPRDASRGKNMTPGKLANPEIAPAVVVATVGGNSRHAKHREEQLKATTWQKLQIRQFTNTSDSAWSIVDTILGVPPVKLCRIQRELDKICKELPKQLRTRTSFFNFFARLFGFR